MRLYLVRHGETQSNRDRLALGRLDPPLSRLGEEQARCLADCLSTRPGLLDHVDALYTSPLLRAQQTAALIGKSLGAPEPTVVEDLTEMDVGETDGLNPQQLRERYPDFLQEWFTDRAGELKMPGGESLADVQDRAWQAIEQIVSDHRGDTNVIAVSHNFVLHAVVCRVLGMPLFEFRRFQQDLASITTIESRGPRTVISQLNDTCHLAHLEKDPGWTY